MIKRLAQQQKKLLETGFNVLKPGGTLVYSTCSLEPEENESVISWFLENHNNAKLEEIRLDIKRGKPILEFDGEHFNPEVSKCMRIWPQDNDTDGFFVAKIKKEN
jgi:16S rRNA C967 or C1407 C5-methylase (RsmB/RsmF family)